MAPDLEPMPMARVENSARTGDETYSPSKQQTARGSEDESPEDEGQEDEFSSNTGEDQVGPPNQPAASAVSGKISFFA